MGSFWQTVTVEPVALLYVTALLLELPTYQHYLYHRAQLKIMANASDINDDNHCSKNVTLLDK